MAHEYLKEAKAAHERKLKAYGAGEKSSKAKTWAGFDALNTNEQRGLKPLDKEPELSPETNPRIMRKAGGRIHGADSLKRLDKAPRKGKATGGSRVGPIPTPQEQEDKYSARAAGGKLSEMEWEHSKKDLNEDRKLAKKHGMSMEKWEKSALDKKHDKQQSMEGLKHGGRAKREDGGRLEHKRGSGKAPTTVNVIVGAPKAVDVNSPQGGAPAAGGPGNAPMPMPMPGPMPVPAPNPAMAGPAPVPPGLAAALAGGAPGPLPPGLAGGLPMPRKDGGRVPYKKPGRKDGYPAMDFGSGSGFGRKQKIDAYGEKPTPYNKDNY